MRPSRKLSPARGGGGKTRRARWGGWAASRTAQSLTGHQRSVLREFDRQGSEHVHNPISLTFRRITLAAGRQTSCKSKGCGDARRWLSSRAEMGTVPTKETAAQTRTVVGRRRIFWVKPMELAPKVYVGIKKHRVKNDSKVSGLSVWESGVQSGVCWV